MRATQLVGCAPGTPWFDSLGLVVRLWKRHPCGHCQRPLLAKTATQELMGSALPGGGESDRPAADFQHSHLGDVTLDKDAGLCFLIFKVGLMIMLIVLMRLYPPHRVAESTEGGGLWKVPC